MYIVLEKLSELDTVLKEAKALGVKPRLGLRARLASQGKGKWQASGGEKSKFGLSASQCMTVMNRLRELDMLDSLQLLHFHLARKSPTSVTFAQALTKRRVFSLSCTRWVQASPRLTWVAVWLSTTKHPQPVKLFNELQPARICEQRGLHHR